MSTTSGFIRAGAATAGIVVVMLGLAGCQAGTAAANGAGGSAVAISSAATSTAPIVQLPSMGTASTPAAAPASPAAVEPPQSTSAAAPHSPAPPNPTPSPCPFPEQDFVRIVSVSFNNVTSLDQIAAEPAKGLCGAGVPDDEQYTVTGPAVDFDVFPGVQITGIDQAGQPFSETWAQFAASDLGEYGGFYGIDLNDGVEVTVIDQYFHP
jgi:hypothetical protein